MIFVLVIAMGVHLPRAIARRRLAATAVPAARLVKLAFPNEVDMAFESPAGSPIGHELGEVREAYLLRRAS
jgi:hypothetical protein